MSIKSKIFFMETLRPYYKWIVIGVLLIGFFVLKIENSEQNKFSDPVKVGRIFSWALMLRNADVKDTLKDLSDKSLHSKLASMSYQNITAEDSYISNLEPNLSDFRRVGDTIVATYSLLVEGQKAWHYTLTLTKSTSQTPWQKLKNWVFFNFPFGSKIVLHLSGNDKWLVTGFVPESYIENKEYENLLKLSMEQFNEHMNKQIDQIMKEDELKLQNERAFLKTFADQESKKQQTETKEIFDSYFKSVWMIK